MAENAKLGGTMWLLCPFMVGALVVGGAAGQETFEHVTCTPPPGWSVQHADGGRQYLRHGSSGMEIISPLTSQPATGAPAQIFADMWRVHATKILTGPPPRPTVGREADATVLGARQGRSHGTTGRVVVAALLRGDRVLGVVGTATGAEPQAGDLGFDVPAGYVQQRNGDVVILTPATANERTPCIYGLAPPRSATTSLEADAEAALVQTVVPGFRRLDDQHYAMRGTAAAGWPYVWYRGAFEGELAGERQAVNAMALVLPAGRGRVHVVWGLGGISRCLLDDPTFEQLFHSLRPSGWPSDQGQALTRALVGTWRYTAGVSLQQFSFKTDGRYDRDLGSRAQVGVTERTSATASAGRFTLRDGELLLAPDHRPQDPDRYYVRVYEEWSLGGWKHVLALYDGRANPPLVIPYFRVDESP